MSKYAKTPTIYQMEATECGAASLSMIFAYFGKNIPLEQMRIETGVSRDGCNAGNIMRCAKRYGLDCHGFRKEPAALKELQPPCIIHWNFNHFVVFEGFKGKFAYINDPAMGRRKLTMEELDEAFTGVVLTFEKTSAFVKEKKKNTLMDFIKHRLKGQYSTLFRLLFVGLLLVFPGLLFPVLSQVFMDDVLVGGNTSWFSKLILFMCATLLLQAGLTVYRNLVLAKLQKKMVLLSAREFLHNMFRLPISFFDQRYVGDLSGRVSNNANVSVFLAGELAETALNIFVAVFYLILLLIYSPVLTAIAIATVIVNLVVVKISSGMLSNASIKLQQDSGKLAGAVCAGLSITSTLKASGAENEYVGRILGYNAKTICTEQKLSKTQQIINAIPDAVKMIGDVLILIVGGLIVINGDMTVGMLVAFTTLFGSFSEPVDALVGFVKNIQTTKADINRVEDIMNYPLDEKFDTETPKRQIMTKLEGSVELDQIAFGYSKLKDPIVSEFSFKIDCGSSIAFVGSSGCGKSTVSKIVSGLYKPWQGKLFFDGIPVDEIPNEVLNASVSTVSQNITLFSGSIRDNLTMWNDSISESDMIAAAKDACIHDVISQKPGAYDYKLTEGASNMSGGQRQRLEIARALATNPTVLIMDEATSALDPVVEKKIMDNIKRRGCTCVIVAHRLSAIRDCDQIIVMNRGKIVQRGSHDELSQVDGHYRRFISNL
ncbi:MAG: NHLP family bacteriocin export ABC transporter peptidase/permease/ATPase subunit [Ruminococcaceae bacterium]|nr:NHLP family bacteriocin export ABC transporter peptidase/permease/ATPase subunit [Oscillospiraceae bacterium]